MEVEFAGYRDSDISIDIMAMRKEVARESRLRHPRRILLLDGRGRSIPKPV